MAEKFPVDEFDRVSVTGGRHRKPVSFATRFFSGVGYLVSAVVLGVAGYYGLDFASQLTQQAGENPATVNRYVADGASVAVLDGSGRKAVATELANKLADERWNVMVAADLINETDPTITQPTTVIYANSDAAANSAKSLAKLVGDFEIRQESTYPDDITVVIGLDLSK